MTDVAVTVQTKPRRRWPLIAAVIAGVFILGAGAGVYAGVFLAPESAVQAHGEEEGQSTNESAERQEFDVGRLTVVIPADSPAGGKLHLLITPLVVGIPEGGAQQAEQGDKGSDAEQSVAGPIPELRDAFIEYLSQLREAEIRGSVGMVTIRAELLRRARAVAPELNASAVLIQEFIVQ